MDIDNHHSFHHSSPADKRRPSRRINTDSVDINKAAKDHGDDEDEHNRVRGKLHLLFQLDEELEANQHSSAQCHPSSNIAALSLSNSSSECDGDISDFHDGQSSGSISTSSNSLNLEEELEVELLMAQCNLLRLRKEIAESFWLTSLQQGRREEVTERHTPWTSIIPSTSLIHLSEGFESTHLQELQENLKNLFTESQSLDHDTIISTQHHHHINLTDSAKPKGSPTANKTGQELEEGLSEKARMKLVLRQIIMEVEAEAEQLSEVEDMLHLIQREMEDLQKAKNAWHQKTLSAQAQVLALQKGVDEWRLCAINAEHEATLLRSEVEALKNEVENVKQRHAKEQSKWLSNVTTNNNIGCGNNGKSKNNVIPSLLTSSSSSSSSSLSNSTCWPRSPLGEIPVNHLGLFP